MANKKKSSKVEKAEADKKPADDVTEVSQSDETPIEVEDAEIVEEAGPVSETETPDEGDSAGEDSPDDSIAANEATEELADAAEAAPESEPEDSDEPSAETAPAALPPTEPVVIRQGGFVPMVLGGLLAAAIGFGLAWFVLPETGVDQTVITDLQRKIDGQTATLSDLTGRVEALEVGGDLGGVEDALSDNQAAISGLADRLTALETQISDVDAQLSGLASQPTGDGASSAALAAQQQELNDLRAAVDAMTEHSAVLEENAKASAQATLQRAALTRIMTALDAGVAFDSAVADLEGLGVTVPDALARSAASGVPSLTALKESFPDAARAALSVSRDAAGETEGAGFTAFLRTQLGARSLEPREGSDPDAVLSRVEAAAHEGRLSDALAEIEALPEEGRAELADWAAQIQTRQDAVSAAQDLSATLN